MLLIVYIKEGKEVYFKSCMIISIVFKFKKNHRSNGLPLPWGKLAEP